MALHESLTGAGVTTPKAALQAVRQELWVDHLTAPATYHEQPVVGVAIGALCKIVSMMGRERHLTLGSQEATALERMYYWGHDEAKRLRVATDIYFQKVGRAVLALGLSEDEVTLTARAKNTRSAVKVATRLIIPDLRPGAESPERRVEDLVGVRAVLRHGASMRPDDVLLGVKELSGTPDHYASGLPSVSHEGNSLSNRQYIHRKLRSLTELEGEVFTAEFQVLSEDEYIHNQKVASDADYDHARTDALGGLAVAADILSKNALSQQYISWYGAAVG